MTTIHHGDCIETMNAMPPESVDAIVTDPPYGLGFMGKKWDGLPPSLEWAEACYRVLKPGGHIAAFGGTRTWHRLAVAIEDAGFEMRDSLAWLYGSGFPKSMNVGKAIDATVLTGKSGSRSIREATDSREVIGTKMGLPGKSAGQKPGTYFSEAMEAEDGKDLGMRAERLGGSIVEGGHRRDLDITAPATPEAAQWDGWGTALKPAHEPVVLAMKPLDNAALFARIGSQLEALEEACRQRASGAARSSAPTPAASHAGRAATAHDNAATPHEDGRGRTTPTGAAAGSSAQTATSASALTVETFLSTVTSWKACLAEISEATSTSTTSTATRPTTDLQTLSSCLSSIMQSVTAQSTPDPRSWSSLASAADNLFAAGVLSSRSTLALSAAESATASTPPAPQGGAEGSPAFEPIVLARKPLAEKTVARNVLAHGTGAINVDACRIGYTSETDKASAVPQGRATARPGNLAGKAQAWESSTTTTETSTTASTTDTPVSPSPTSASTAHGTARGEFTPNRSDAGRWPANVLLDQHAAAWVDEQSGVQRDGVAVNRNKNPDIEKPHTVYGGGWMNGDRPDITYGGGGGASRFFYSAKAPKSERPNVDGVQHPTVKPLAIMQWLIRLVTPPGGVVLDPFAGSGTTIEAALIEGFNPVGIEMEPDYLPLIQHRIDRQAGTPTA